MFDKISKGFNIGCGIMLLAVLAAIGGGSWALINRLDERVLSIGIGVGLTLLGVLVVAAVLAGKDVLQAYLIRRAVKDDDLSDLKQMAFIMRLMGSTRTPNVNVRMPPGQQQQPVMFGGFLPPGSAAAGQSQPQYVDTTLVDQPLDVK